MQQKCSRLSIRYTYTEKVLKIPLGKAINSLLALKVHSTHLVRLMLHGEKVQRFEINTDLCVLFLFASLYSKEVPHSGEQSRQGLARSQYQ